MKNHEKYLSEILGGHRAMNHGANSRLIIFKESLINDPEGFWDHVIDMMSGSFEGKEN